MDTETRSCFRFVATTQISEIDSQLKQYHEKIVESIEKFQRDGSGWIYSGTEGWELHVYKYLPLQAKSYILTIIVEL